jgi:hypothetical protein
MNLGALMILLDSTSLLHHSLEEDYKALSVEQLLKQVKAAVCPTWYFRNRLHECSPLGNAFNLEIKSIANEMGKVSRGLSITDYVQSATESK